MSEVTSSGDFVCAMPDERTPKRNVKRGGTVDVPGANTMSVTNHALQRFQERVCKPGTSMGEALIALQRRVRKTGKLTTSSPRWVSSTMREEPTWLRAGTDLAFLVRENTLVTCVTKRKETTTRAGAKKHQHVNWAEIDRARLEREAKVMGTATPIDQRDPLRMQMEARMRALNTSTAT